MNFGHTNFYLFKLIHYKVHTNHFFRVLTDYPFLPTIFFFLFWRILFLYKSRENTERDSVELFMLP